MSVDVNPGVAYLINLAKQSTNGTNVHLHALEALGEAGGVAAQEYLVSVAQQATKGTNVHLVAVKALGKASRVYA